MFLKIWMLCAWYRILIKSYGTYKTIGKEGKSALLCMLTLHTYNHKILKVWVQSPNDTVE